MEELQLSKATLDDIVFEGRNKSYGAFILRKKYNRTIWLAVLIASSVFAACLLYPMIQAMREEKVELPPPPKKKLEDIKVVEIPLEKELPPPPPLPKVEVPQLKTVKFVALEITEKPEEEELPPANEEMETQKTSDDTQEGIDDPDADLPVDVDAGKIGGIEGGEDNNTPWMGPITKEINFDGGYASYINKKVSDRLRQYVADKGIKGRLPVTITIGKDGAVLDAMILPGRDIPGCKMCSEEVLEIVKGMPKWTPAENNGVKVVRKITIPVVF